MRMVTIMAPLLSCVSLPRKLRDLGKNVGICIIYLYNFYSKIFLSDKYLESYAQYGAKNECRSSYEVLPNWKVATHFSKTPHYQFY
jgi:hypothetical protein